MSGQALLGERAGGSMDICLSVHLSCLLWLLPARSLPLGPQSRDYSLVQPRVVLWLFLCVENCKKAHSVHNAKRLIPWVSQQGFLFGVWLDDLKSVQTALKKAILVT